MTTYTRDRVICERTDRRPLPEREYGRQRRIQAESKLYSLGGVQAPYFSCTAEIGRSGARDCDSGGCLHEEIMRWLPELAPVVAVHLSDEHGEPMHGAANGKYWLNLLPYMRHRGTPNWVTEWRSPRSQYDAADLFETDERGIEWSPVRAADHFRVDVDEMRRIRAAIMSNTSRDRIATAYDDYVESCRPRWQAEADLAIAVIRRER